jgi:GT2 family glycosyltransferase
MAGEYAAAASAAPVPTVAAASAEPAATSVPTPAPAEPAAAAPTPKPLSVAIVTYNSAEAVNELLYSMQTQLDLSRLEVYVIDNASTDNTALYVERGFPWVRLIRNARNVGFGAAHNQLLSCLHSKYHAVLNPDIVFLEDSLGQLSDYLDAHLEAVMATPRVLNRDGSEQHLPKRLPAWRYLLARRILPANPLAQRLNRHYTRADEDLSTPTAIEHASGSIFIIRTEAFCQLGGFDERFFLYFEDNDLSRRAAALGQIIYCPQTSVVHGYARDSLRDPRALAHLLRSALRYFRKHRL